MASNVKPQSTKAVASKGQIDNDPVATTPGSVASKSLTQASAEANDKKKKGRSGKHKVYGGRYKPGGDVLTQAAIDNAYYVCHNVQDCLYIRGFRWEAGATSRKSRRKQ